MPVAKLDNAPRCQHTKFNGQPCSAPARRHRKYCVFHEAAHAKRPDTQVRLIDDAMSLQFALFQVMRSLDDQTLDTEFSAQLSGKEVPQDNDPNLPPPPRFNIQACADPDYDRAVSAGLFSEMAPRTQDCRLGLPADRACGTRERKNRSIDRETVRRGKVTSRQPKLRQWVTDFSSSTSLKKSARERVSRMPKQQLNGFAHLLREHRSTS